MLGDLRRLKEHVEQAIDRNSAAAERVLRCAANGATDNAARDPTCDDPQTDDSTPFDG